MADLSISGLASGFDWKTLVDQLTQLQRAPEQSLQTEQNAIQQRNSAYSSIATELGVLQSNLATLKDPTSYDSRSATTSDSTIATASAASGAAVGSYAFHIIQVATAATLNGTADAASPLSGSSDVSGLTLSSAKLATAVTAGTITVNGKQITIGTSDSLQSVFDAINTATSGDVTATYDETSDKVTLSSSHEVVLGSSADTSNFFGAFKLSNNGTGQLSSASALGAVQTSQKLGAANLSTAINDGGGNGSFKVNGVSIAFTNNDSISTVLSRINNSNAGVSATYDPLTDRFKLSNKSTGDVGVALEDVSGNFLAATGLLGGTLAHGKDTLYTINGGATITSHNSTITSDSSGIANLSVTAIKGGDVTVGISADTTSIKTAITSFVAEYNRVQSLIDTNVASTTSADGKVTAGTLSGEGQAYEITRQLRGIVTSTLSGLAGTLKRLDSIGISSNGNDNTLALGDSTALDNALATNLTDVKDLFSNSTSGLAVQLDKYLTNTIGDSGSLVSHQSVLQKQIASITTQISDQERLVLAYKDRMTAEFVAMETAQAQTTQQQQYLTKNFP